MLDMLMPEMDGYTFLKKLKSFEEYRDIKVAVSTSKGQFKRYFEIEEDYMKPGGFLEKPYTVEMLKETLDGLQKQL